MASEEPTVATPDEGEATASGDADCDPSGTDAVDGEEAAPDGGRDDPQTHTIRLELTDEPGQLLSALEPIADNGGNLMSIVHERGRLTPRGRIPVEVDLSCPPERFDAILTDLRADGVTVVEADAEQYADEVTVVLVGHLIDTDLSGTLRAIQAEAAASVADVSLSAPAGTENRSSARLRLRAREGRADAALDAVREVAADKNLTVIEPAGGA